MHQHIYTFRGKNRLVLNTLTYKHNFDTSMENPSTNTIAILVYSHKHKMLWDDFVSTSKNGVFLFYRNYMDYHSDRYEDHSLLFFRKGKLLGLMPANVEGDQLHSHDGLTFAGIISNKEMKTQTMMEIFESLIAHCRKQGFRKLEYKAVPNIYHSVPAEEDLYALFRHNAKLIARCVSSCVLQNEDIEFSQERKRTIRKAQGNSIAVRQSFDFNSFMKIEEKVLLERHNTRPVHTAEELRLLSNRFPNQIKLFGAFKNNLMLAGSVVFEHKNLAHAQYAANSDEGWDLGALDLVFEYLISDYYKNKKYFDFGISTEKQGQVLNNGLVRYKEGYGARAVMYDTYQLSI